jgi:hypothetical protein
MVSGVMLEVKRCTYQHQISKDMLIVRYLGIFQE